MKRHRFVCGFTILSFSLGAAHLVACEDANSDARQSFEVDSSGVFVCQAFCKERNGGKVLSGDGLSICASGTREAKKTAKSQLGKWCAEPNVGDISCFTPGELAKPCSCSGELVGANWTCHLTKWKQVEFDDGGVGNTLVSEEKKIFLRYA